LTFPFSQGRGQGGGLTVGDLVGISLFSAKPAVISAPSPRHHRHPWRLTRNFLWITRV